tara:strand:+ start:326 stop:442 length:117 start_codon:yes stop_codon:yes gene_type:complete
MDAIPNEQGMILVSVNPTLSNILVNLSPSGNAFTESGK